MRCISLILLLTLTVPSQSAKPKTKPVAGRADVLRHIPKKFASFQSCDLKSQSVTLLIEGEKKPSTWKLLPGAEVKVHGWWGHLDQFQKGDRVWTWFAIDRTKKPRAILMIADELTEQWIHNEPARLTPGGEEGKVHVTSCGKKRTLMCTIGEDIEDKRYIQSAGGSLRVSLTEEQMKSAVEKQKEYLRGHWRKTGLPGMVTLLHPLGGEMELTLDHQSMRWGRYLKNRDAVTVVVARGKPIKGVVRKVDVFRELTRVTVVTKSGVDQLDTRLGDRIHLQVPEPPKEIQQSVLPTDMGRPREKDERMEWILASIHCTCSVPGDRCTGMFYSLASCNRNACGNPNMIRRIISKLIDERKTDKQIFEHLLKVRGPMLFRPHLAR